MAENRKAIVVADLSYGDSGKGSLVDFLTRSYGAHTVVRYNGGAQAAHNVVSPDGRHHTFAQFGSGTFVSGTRTHLSRFMMVNPFSIFPEERHLRELGIQNAFELLTIDQEALITTPFQVAANRLKEIARDANRHGSCGMGIGETMSDHLTYRSRILFARDLLSRKTMLAKLRFIRELKLEEIEPLISSLPNTGQAKAELAVLTDPKMDEVCVNAYEHFARLVRIVDPNYVRRLFRRPGTVIFEGAQGVLLDELFGFAPYTTWSTTTFKNALTLLADSGYSDQIVRLGLFRGYTTRHGAGPFVTEDAELTSSIPDQHNGNNPWQREFRVGYFDLVAGRYALEVSGGADALAITCLDRLAELPSWKVCHSYVYTGEASRLPAYFEAEGRKIQGIRVRTPADLDHQERLTGLLQSCKPNHGEQIRTDHVEADLEAYLSSLQENLGVPIGITSAGLTANEKRCTTLWQNYAGTKPLAA